MPVCLSGGKNQWQSLIVLSGRKSALGDTVYCYWLLCLIEYQLDVNNVRAAVVYLFIIVLPVLLSVPVLCP